MEKALSAVLACSMALPLVVCGGGSKPTGASTTAATGDTTTAIVADTTATDIVAAPETGVEAANKDKPLVWSNRQPSSSATGQLDMTALNFNKDTYYVGFDTNQGAELQGTMVKGYIEKNVGSIDHNNNGVIGYVLAISDIGYNDSIARTRDIRKTFGTAIEKDGSISSDPVGTNADGVVTVIQGGLTEVGEKTHVAREPASQEMRNSASATRDVVTTGSAIGTWSSSFGDQIDVAASNNDGMGTSMFSAWSKDNRVPTFGYDANSDAVAAIAEGCSDATNQHADVQAYLILRVLRNALGGVDIDTGTGTTDDAGNILSPDVYVYKADERSYYALNVAVTAENYTDLIDSTAVYTPVSNQLDEVPRAMKNVWLNIYNSADNFLGPTHQPLLQKYDKLLNLKVDHIGGGGQTKSSITNRLGNPGQCDVFAIDMIKTDNAALYISLLER